MFEGLFQPMHLLVIFLIALLVFGPKRLGDIGKGLGEGIRSFKSGFSDDKPETKPTALEAKPPVQETKPPAQETKPPSPEAH
jgi:sec-independent protein translocase protein TatA